MNKISIYALMILTMFGLALVPTIKAQTKNTTNTLRLDENAKSAPAKLADISWLTGHWRGKGLGGQADETWSMPAAGTMVGMFRLIQNDKLAFSEFFVLVEENDSLVLRLKHFDPLFNGWEKRVQTEQINGIIGSRIQIRISQCERVAITVDLAVDIRQARCMLRNRSRVGRRRKILPAAVG